MNNFKMTNMPKVYFGQGALKEALNTELKTVGDNVLLAYGGGSIKKTGIYDEVVTLLKEAGKNIFEFNNLFKFSLTCCNKLSIYYFLFLNCSYYF